MSKKPKTTTKNSVKRAQIIFTTLLITSYISTTSTIYLAWNQGIIQKAYAYSSQAIVDWYKAATKPTPTYKPTSRKKPSPTPKPAAKKVVKNTQVILTQPTQSPSAPSTQFDQDAWEAQVEASRQKAQEDYQQKVDQMNADFEQSKLDAQANQDEWVKQKQAEQDAWKAEHGF